jgi:hypothetical protein
VTGQKAVAVTYEGWRRERLGVFAGLTGGQTALVALFALPVLIAMGRSAWAQVFQLLPVSLVGAALVAVPVRGRPAFRWLVDLALFHVGTATGWSAWRSAAATGAASPRDLARPDLPGVIAGLRTHDGPPFGPTQSRVCIVQDPRAGRWSATARLTHAGVAASDEVARDAYATALGSLLAAVADTGHVAGLSLLIRTVPDDGAERASWVADHEVGDVPAVVASSGRGLESSVVSASVRHEVFLTVSVAETKVRRPARDAGGGASGRAKVLYRYLTDLEWGLRAIGASDVRWLDGAGLATAIRTGYNLADGAGIATPLPTSETPGMTCRIAISGSVLRTRFDRPMQIRTPSPVELDGLPSTSRWPAGMPRQAWPPTARQERCGAHDSTVHAHNAPTCEGVHSAPSVMPRAGAAPAAREQSHHLHKRSRESIAVVDLRQPKRARHALRHECPLRGKVRRA